DSISRSLVHNLRKMSGRVLDVSRQAAALGALRWSENVREESKDWAKEEQRPADLKSASQSAVQNAVQTVLRDTLEPPKTTLRPPYSTTTYARLSALRIGCLYQLSYVGFWFALFSLPNCLVVFAVQLLSYDLASSCIMAAVNVETGHNGAEQVRPQVGSGTVRHSARPSAELKHTFHCRCGRRRRSPHVHVR